MLTSVLLSFLVFVPLVVTAYSIAYVLLHELDIRVNVLYVTLHLLVYSFLAIQYPALFAAVAASALYTVYIFRNQWSDDEESDTSSED